MTREEAIKEIKSWDFLEGKEIEAIQTLIPELKESEDERIRKEIIDFIQWSVDRHFMRKDFHQAKRPAVWIAYLEKQKEQKPELPKPHKGDDTNPYDMSVSEAQEYAIKRGFGIPYNDGEVYVDERHMTQTIGNILRWADEHPKEQKPIDYKVELKKCKDNPLYFYDKYVSIKQKLAEWSEEDERMLSRCIKSVECSKQFADSETYKAAKDVEMNWLKSLPKRFNLQPKQEWSEEDEDTINLMIAILRENYSNCLFKTNSANTTRMSAISTDMLIKRIEALRPQPKQEWSKEDEKHINNILDIIDYWKTTTHFVSYQGGTIDADIAWLKSLRPQYHGDVTMTEAYKMGKEAGEASHWKPSDEQLRPLEYAIDYFKKKRNDTTYLESLYNDLEKL